MFTPNKERDFSNSQVSTWRRALAPQIDTNDIATEITPIYIKYDIPYGDINELRKNISELRKDKIEFQERLKKVEEQLSEISMRQIVPLQFLESEKLELKQTVSVVLEYNMHDKIWIVDLPELDIYGSGQDEGLAIKDFKKMLEEDYFDLKENADNLGPVLQTKWAYLLKFIKEK